MLTSPMTGAPERQDPPPEAPALDIFSLLDGWAERTPDASALLAPGRRPLSYRRLAGLVRDTAVVLSRLDVGRGDRVGIVLPNGPEMAVAFLATAAAAVCAPLNPGYGEGEFRFYLADLNARAVIVPAGAPSPALRAAEASGASLVRLSPQPDAEAGAFTLAGDRPSLVAPDGPAAGAGTALVLHTSGTTARPKIVPLSERNLCISAHNIRRSLQLTAEDCCLNVMPLFHIHGLIGALLASLAAGGSVVCTPGFHAPKFFAWLEQFDPTWYTAVPTMHQAILARVAAHSHLRKPRRLRFIRSCSASLPPPLMAGLESAFGVPVIEAYGMTEAAHQMASNPLPPARRKPGSVGLPAGPELAIMDQAGNLLPPGVTGEVVIRGDNITRGYEANPQANQAAFCQGWFRTGDQGHFDSDGYLFLTGRLKELINRGGEKISPREIEEVLLAHPAIEQAVAFAVLDSRLGEDVGVAVVLKEGAALTESQVREYAAGRLASFKVPRVVKIARDIPKGATGKIQRVGLAERLGIRPEAEGVLAARPPRVAPSTALETRLAALWCEVLRLPECGVHDDFFASGGDSVLATELVAGLAAQTGDSLSLVSFLETPSISGMARQIEEGRGRAPSSRRLVAIRPGGSRPPLFCVGTHHGGLVGFSNLARHLGPGQPLFGFHPLRAEAGTGVYRVEDLAAGYVEDLLGFRPQGPYLLAGECFGGQVAFEMALQLQQRGQPVALLVLLNAFNHAWTRQSARAGRAWDRLSNLGARIRSHGQAMGRLRPAARLAYLSEYARGFLTGRTLRLAYTLLVRCGLPLPASLRDNRYAGYHAGRHYVPRFYAGRVILFRGQRPRPGILPVAHMGWEGLAGGGLESHEIADHGTQSLLAEPAVVQVAERLRVLLEALAPPAGA